MVFGQVQRFKVIVVGLHLGTLGYREAHAEKDILHLAEHLGERMLLPHRLHAGGQRDIDLLGFQTVVELRLFQRGDPPLDLLLDARAHLIGQLADDRALLSG